MKCILACAVALPVFADEYHFVAFHYKSSTSEAQKQEITSRFLSLKDQCTAEGTKVLALSAGDQNSKEQVSQSYSNAFLVQFGGINARDRYVGCLDKPCQQGGEVPRRGFCQAHDNFKVFVGPFLEVNQGGGNYNSGVMVYDYQAELSGSLPRKEIHTVLFRYKDGTSPSTRAWIRSSFLALADQCPGIESIVSGDQNSKENVDQQYQDGYVVVASDTKARDHYVGCLDKPCQVGGTVPTGGFCQGHDDFKVLVGDFLAVDGYGPSELDGPDANHHYNPGVLVFDFLSTSHILV